MRRQTFVGMNAIEVLDYSPEWASVFLELQAVYHDRLEGLVDDVQHVGSTAVPGLAAKPVIDIDIVVADPGRLRAVIERLGELGYVHRGSLGISDREAFGRKSDSAPFSDLRAHWPAHHLYLCPASSVSLRNHLTLRDALRAHAALAVAYAALKRRLAEAFPFDIDRYVAGETAFITGILEQAGFERDALDRIVEENRIV